MNCSVCGKGPKEGVTVYRQNPKGEKGIWACEEHAVRKPDSPLMDLIKTLENQK